MHKSVSCKFEALEGRELLSASAPHPLEGSLIIESLAAQQAPLPATFPRPLAQPALAAKAKAKRIIYKAPITITKAASIAAIGRAPAPRSRPSASAPLNAWLSATPISAHAEAALMPGGQSQSHRPEHRAYGLNPNVPADILAGSSMSMGSQMSWPSIIIFRARPASISTAIAAIAPRSSRSRSSAMSP